MMEASSEWQEERKEEDLEDLELVSSGGEPGIEMMVPKSSLYLISSSQGGEDGEQRALCTVAMMTVLS
jgi:hypothetical protein